MATLTPHSHPPSSPCQAVSRSAFHILPSMHGITLLASSILSVPCHTLCAHRSSTTSVTHHVTSHHVTVKCACSSAFQSATVACIVALQSTAVCRTSSQHARVQGKRGTCIGSITLVPAYLHNTQSDKRPSIFQLHKGLSGSHRATTPQHTNTRMTLLASTSL